MRKIRENAFTYTNAGSPSTESMGISIVFSMAQFEPWIKRGPCPTPNVIFQRLLLRYLELEQIQKPKLILNWLKNKLGTAKSSNTICDKKKGKGIAYRTFLKEGRSCTISVLSGGQRLYISSFTHCQSFRTMNLTLPPL